ncbi:hypothetical protein HDV06_002867 [Boothiomyces sp. JEL0866]|nr:hypothetical protein HDV06_002867 [Boothiomyces sp. JEL0866]
MNELLLIYQYLKSTPLNKTTQMLLDELEANNLLPTKLTLAGLEPTHPDQLDYFQPLQQELKIRYKLQENRNFINSNRFSSGMYGKRLKLLKTNQGHLCPIFCLVYDKTSSLVFTGGDDNLVKVWCTRTGYLLHTLRPHQTLIRQEQGVIVDLSINSTNTLLATCSSDKTIRLWDMNTWEPKGYYLVGKGITTISFMDELLVVTCVDSKTRIYNIMNDNEATVVNSGTLTRDKVIACAISPCNTRFATGGDDGIIYMYNTNTSVSLATLYPTHMARVNDVAFSHDGSMMCSASKDGKIAIYTDTVKVLALTDYKLQAKDFENLFEDDIDLAEPKNIEVFSLVWTCDDSRIVCASSDFLVRVWDSKSGELLHSLKAHSRNIFTLSAHPRYPDIVLSTCHGGRVVVWDVKAGKPIYHDQISDSVLSGSFSPDGETFCVADSRGFTYLYGTDSLDQYVAPIQQFHAVDWIMVKEDHHGSLIDEQAQVPSHLVEMGSIMNLQRVPYSNCTPKRIVVETDEVENAIEFKKQIERFVNPILNPINLDKKQLLKRRKMVYEESDTENITYDVPDFNLPIIPLPNSSGDEYTGDDDDEDEEDNIIIDDVEENDENEENEEITPLAVEPELESGIRLRRRERRNERESRRRAHEARESNEPSRELRRESRRQRQVYDDDSDTLSEVESESFTRSERRRVRRRRQPIQVEEEEEDPELIALREQQREERRQRQQERRRQQQEHYERELSTQSAEAHPRRRNILRANQETEIRRSERARLMRSLHNAQLPSELDRHQRLERRLQRMMSLSDQRHDVEISNQSSSIRRNSLDESASSARRAFQQHSARRPSLDETQMHPPSERLRTRRHQSLDDSILSEPIRTRRQIQEMESSRPRPQRPPRRQRSPDSPREPRPKRRVVYDESESEDGFEDELQSNKRSREGERRTLPRRESRRGTVSQSIRRSSRLHSDSNNDEVEHSSLKIIESDTDSEDSLVKPAKKKSKIEPNKESILRWLSTDTQSWTPYLPQIKDTIVYIKQGHLNFVEKTKHIFKSKVDSSLPELLLCHVKGICWTPGDIVTCTVTLSIYPALELSDTPLDLLPTISVTFFEAENVPDFLILWTEFEESMTRTWDVGDSVVIRYADSTSSGKILAVNDTVSQWEKYTVQDEDDDSQITVSPWELCNPNSNFAEIESIPEPELSRIAAIILEKTDDPMFEPFLNQVPYDEYPDYLETVAYPMYIGLIQARLGNHFYRRVQQVAWEWDQMCQNVFAYNAHDSPICDLTREHLLPVKYQILNIPQPAVPAQQKRKPINNPKRNIVKHRKTNSDFDDYEDESDGEELSDVDISSVSEDFLDEFVVSDSDSD